MIMQVGSDTIDPAFFYSHGWGKPRAASWRENLSNVNFFDISYLFF